ncbi:MAG TPA: phospholipase D-like domain-containing protein, partial [Longimicrobiaceae bacterium]|nr:phospholipase D-like domain-containing protein [Longimicrobiaceae bacterium]
MSIFLSIPWWITLFFIIGVVALIAVILALFSKLGDRPASFSATEVCRVDSRGFLVSLTGTLNAPLQQGGTAQLLNNGDEFFPAMLRAMREARCSINFMTYIWAPGKASDMMFDMLIEKARDEVPVRVLIDAFGGYSAPRERIAELRRAGGKWAWFHPARFGKLTRLHRRNHRRAIIIDGRVGFTGGASVMDKWLGNAQDPEHWRDCMVEVRGGIATNLQSAFTQLWS